MSLFNPIDDDTEEFGDTVSVEYFKTLTDNLNYLIDSVPVGEITPIFVVPGLNDVNPQFYQPCNGSAITDQTSPLRGYNTPDMLTAGASINFLNFRAKVPGTITITYIDWIPPVTALYAQVTAGPVTFVADTIGSAGNSITIVFLGDGVGTPTVTVSGTTITIHNDIIFGNTAAEIVSAVNGTPTAAALVNASTSTPLATTALIGIAPLEGGRDYAPPVGEAGNEIVSVSGQDITVRLQSGVSTIQGIKAKLDAHSGASALISTFIPLGTPTTTQTAPNPTLTLVPGLYLKGATNLGTVGSTGGSNAKNLQHSHGGRTQNYHGENDGDTDDDRFSAKADHTHGINLDLGTSINFEPAHLRIQHYIKIN